MNIIVGFFIGFFKLSFLFIVFLIYWIYLLNNKRKKRIFEKDQIMLETIQQFIEQEKKTFPIITNFNEIYNSLHIINNKQSIINHKIKKNTINLESNYMNFTNNHNNNYNIKK